MTGCPAAHSGTRNRGRLGPSREAGGNRQQESGDQASLAHLRTRFEKKDDWSPAFAICAHSLRVRFRSMRRLPSQVETDLADTASRIRPQRERYYEAASSVYTATAVAEAPPAVDLSAARARTCQAEADLAALQGETPMIRVAVDAQIIGEVISAWTGIPVGKMMKDEISTVLSLPTFLGPARDRADARTRNHRPADLTPRARVSTIPTSRSASSCWSVPAA